MAGDEETRERKVFRGPSSQARVSADAGQTRSMEAEVKRMRDSGECECLIRFYQLLNQAKQPTLQRAELYTLTGDGDNKDHDTGIFVSVKTADGATELASISNADSSGKDMTEYNDDSWHIVPLVIDAPGASKSDCANFKVHMSQKTNGDDTWDIDTARVTLYFSDGSNLVAEQLNFQLVDDGAATDFSAL